jgi:hypothetical protein
MARRTHTYAIRLAVEGGGQVKAELVSVGQSGERSLKRIETAGDGAPASRRGVALNRVSPACVLSGELPSLSRCKWRPVGSHAAARSGALSAKSAVVRSVRPSRVSYREGNLMSGDC